MRLIDADELRAGTCAECALKGEKCLGDDCDWDSIWHIDHAPTVDAIPVEWIMKWSNKRYRETHRDVSIVDVLEAWQKEQEAR